MQRDGLFVGASAAMNCVGAVKAAQALGPGHTVVTILCDGGQRHLSRFHSPACLKGLGLAPRVGSVPDSQLFDGSVEKASAAAQEGTAAAEVASGAAAARAAAEVVAAAAAVSRDQAATRSAAEGGGVEAAAASSSSQADVKSSVAVNVCAAHLLTASTPDSKASEQEQEAQSLVVETQIEMSEEMVRQYDTRQDGQIDAAELQQMLNDEATARARAAAAALGLPSSAIRATESVPLRLAALRPAAVQAFWDACVQPSLSGQPVPPVQQLLKAARRLEIEAACQLVQRLVPHLAAATAAGEPTCHRALHPQLAGSQLPPMQRAPISSRHGTPRLPPSACCSLTCPGRRLRSQGP